MSREQPSPKQASVFWERALTTLSSAEKLTESDPETAASCAYYAAFNGVSALFALEGQSFSKHSGVETAVHRDLVKTGRWSAELGACYSDLVRLREESDYGRHIQMTADMAKEAIEWSRHIIREAHMAHPAELPLVENA